MFFRGNALYSGDTFVNEGVFNTTDLPPESTLFVNGGHFNAETPVTAGAVTMSRGSVSGQVESESFKFSAGLLGRFTQLLGSGRIEKVSTGTVLFEGSLSDFRGTLTIQEGYWSAESLHALSPVANEVLPGGRLVVNDSPVHGNVNLAGGELSPNGAGELVGDVQVTEDSSLFLLSGLHADGRSGRLTINGQLHVVENTTLKLMSRDYPIPFFPDLILTQPIVVDAQAAIVGEASIEGELTIAEGSRISPGFDDLPGTIASTSMVLGPGGQYIWDINDAQGLAGAITGNGWDLLLWDEIDVTASEIDPFTIQVRGADAGVDNLVAAQDYAWALAREVNRSDSDSEWTQINTGALSLNLSDLIVAAPELDPDWFSLTQDESELQLRYWGATSRLDFDKDKRISIADIDALVADIAAGGTDQVFDLDGNGTVDHEDLNIWRRDAADYLGVVNEIPIGDANLDGRVNASDLNALAIHYLTQSPAWSTGDFNASGGVDSADLNQLALNWLVDSSKHVTQVSNAVPEPKFLEILFPIALLTLVKSRKR